MAATTDRPQTEAKPQSRAGKTAGPNLHQRLLEVQRAVTRLCKDGTSKAEGHFRYVSSSQVLQPLREAMDEAGVLLGVNVVEYTLHRDAAYGGKQHLTEVMVEFTWINADDPDDREVCRFPGQGIDGGEKGIGKAVTYAEKYFLLKFFHIGTDDADPDAGEAPANGESKPATARQQAKQEPQALKVPAHVDKLRRLMTDKLGIPAAQHQVTLDALAGKPVNMAALSESDCGKAWAKLQAIHAAPAETGDEEQSEPPDPELPADAAGDDPWAGEETDAAGDQQQIHDVTVADYTQASPPTYSQLKEFWGTVSGLGQARQALIANQAGIDLTAELTPDDCWQLWRATWDCIGYSGTGELVWKGVA